MKHLKAYQIFESEKSATYTTEQMDKFVTAIVDLIPWDPAPGFKKITLTLPYSTSSSVQCSSKEEAIENWEKAKKLGQDPNTVWHIWKADMGGSLNKPKYTKGEGYDMDRIMEIVSKRPQAYRRMDITFHNEDKAKTDAAISAEYGQGKNMGD